MRTTLIILIILAATGAAAQLPLMDRGVRIEGLWCFPLYGDTLRYVYLPAEASLAATPDNKPQFSYMRYVMPAMPGSGAGTIEESDGGAILNFLVLYNTAQQQVAAAEKALRRRLKNDSIRIGGPLVFRGGRYSLVSSIITGDSLVKKTQVLSTGNAPVLENSNVALSFSLGRLTSQLLMENFKMNTPDVSLVFDMEFSGLTADYDAELEVDWTEVKKQMAFNAGIDVYYVSAEVKLALDELFRKQAVKLVVHGENTSMETLLNAAYDKLLNMLFDPVQPEQLPERQQNGLMDALGQMLGQSISGGTGLSTFSLNVGYQLKEMKSTGKSKLFFKGSSVVQRHHYITFNIGNLFKSYGSDPDIFVTRPLSAGPFQRRTITVGVDGDLEKEFDRILNSVTVILRKDHLNGEQTEQTLLINKELVKNDRRPSLVYGHRADSANWLQYRQRTIWQFRGGAVYESDWNTQEAAMINLYVPFRRKTIVLEGDMQLLKQKGIRAISVQINYPFFSQEKQERVTVGINEQLTQKFFEITLPNDLDEVDYTITWVKSNGETAQKRSKDKIGIIFIDEL